mgnify:CR=1 FL=1
MWNEGYGAHMTNFGDGWWFLPMGIHGLFSLLIFGLLIYGVVLAVRSFSNNHKSNHALDALSSRYAAGDIDREEYIAKKKDLQD